MKEKIIEIIGFMMEPERAELKADEIIILFNNEIEYYKSIIGDLEEDITGLQVRILEKRKEMRTMLNNMER